MKSSTLTGKPLESNRIAEKWRKRGREIPALIVLEVCLAIAGCAGRTGDIPGGNQVSTVPSPRIVAISPIFNLAGSQPFTLTVTGTNFVSSSVVNFGGTPFAATFISSTQLTATVSAAAIASVGTATVTVTNLAAGAVPSNAMTFTIYPASSSGTFTPTGDMTSPRADHTATLLPNGMVLIAGGVFNEIQPLASAELFDPSTGKFTLTGSMTNERTGHQATLLTNGKVLIVGGYDLGGGEDEALGSAELFDLSTGVFTPTGSMINVQPVASATLLPDGRVFVAGLNDPEIYDPASGTFASAGAYVHGPLVIWNTVNLLQDGRVLLTGCVAPCKSPATELFDPRSGTFSLTGQMQGSGSLNTATLLMDGKVLFVGDDEGDESPSSAQIYDPVAGTFTSIGNTKASHVFAPAVLLADGRVLITGGDLADDNGSVGSDLYLPATGTFAFAGIMTTGRHRHAATLLGDGTVLITGGFSVGLIPTSSAEIYKPR